MGKGKGLLDEIIIKLLRGEASPEESERVARWRQASPENQARYEAVRRVWMATDLPPLGGDVDLSVVPGIVSAAAAREKGDVSPGKPRQGGLRPALRWALPLAAAIGAVGLGVHQWVRESASSVVLEASGGRDETFVLEDGTFVRLASGSRLSQEGEGNERRFELEGRGLFAVTRDESRPFVVVASGVEARVLGTRFEVRALDGGDQQIGVLEGRVEVRNAWGRVELTAGDLSVASAGLPPSRTTPDDLLEVLEWPEGTLLFRDTPLAQVAREVARQYGVPVQVEGAALRATRISAWYGTEPFRDVIESLCAATNATCTVTDTLAVLR